MLKDTIGFLLKLLNQYIKDTSPQPLVEDTVVPGNIAFLDAFNDASADRLTNKVIASVINIQQEATLRNLPRKRAGLDVNGDPTAIEQSSPIFLNVYLMFSANNSNYENALLHISDVLSFFQVNHVFRPADHPTIIPQFPEVENIETLIADLYSTSFEELNQIWSVLGGKYTPSALYKLRLVPIQAAPETGASVVRSVRLDEFSN